MHSHAQSPKNFIVVVVLFTVIFLLLINIQKPSGWVMGPGYGPRHVSLRKLNYRDSYVENY